MGRQLFYFGCIEEKGHYFWKNESSKLFTPRIKNVNPKILDHIDGMFVPVNSYEQGIALESTIPPLRIIAWHDYTVDNRPGSNSVLIGYWYNDAEEMFADANKLFSSVMNRQPKPVIQIL